MITKGLEQDLVIKWKKIKLVHTNIYRPVCILSVYVFLEVL